MKYDVSYSPEDRELFLEFLKTGTVWGIYYGMPQTEIHEKFGLPDSQYDGETSYFNYRWFQIALRGSHLPNDEWWMERAIGIQILTVPLGLFGLKPRNETDASRIITYLEKRDLFESCDESSIYLKSGLKLEYQILPTPRYKNTLFLSIEVELKDIPNAKNIQIPWSR